MVSGVQADPKPSSVTILCISILGLRHGRIKMQFLHLRFKHPKNSCTSDELSGSNFFSGVYHPKDVPDEKSSLALAHWEHGNIETLN